MSCSLNSINSVKQCKQCRAQCYLHLWWYYSVAIAKSWTLNEFCFLLQVSKWPATEPVTLPKVGGGEDGAKGGECYHFVPDQERAHQALPDQAGPVEGFPGQVWADEGLPDEAVEHVASGQVGEEQLQKSIGELSSLLKQGELGNSTIQILKYIESKLCRV